MDVGNKKDVNDRVYRQAAGMDKRCSSSQRGRSSLLMTRPKGQLCVLINSGSDRNARLSPCKPTRALQAQHTLLMDALKMFAQKFDESLRLGR